MDSPMKGMVTRGVATDGAIDKSDFAGWLGEFEKGVGSRAIRCAWFDFFAKRSWL
jgi:hypothetical protein